MIARRLTKVKTFQSTLPLRGATLSACLHSRLVKISIHAPLTGSDLPHHGRIGRQVHFNPRSPYGERQRAHLLTTGTAGFQSTLPLRGATAEPIVDRFKCGISIHAPLTGSDQNGCVGLLPGFDFNPRSPYGERHGC